MNFAFSPDGSLLATETLMDKTIRLWNTQSGEELARTSLGEKHIGCRLLVWSPDGTALAGVRRLGEILTVWDIVT
jgi:WD40 repeat protein